MQKKHNSGAGIDRRTFMRLVAGAGAGAFLGSVLPGCQPQQAATTVPTMNTPVPTVLPPTATAGVQTLNADVIMGAWPGYEEFFQRLSFNPYLAEHSDVTINMEINPASQIYAMIQASAGASPPMHGTMMNDAFAWKGRQEGVWQEVTADQVPNLAKVPGALLQGSAGPFWAMNFFGIAYNPEFVPEGIQSWTQLYEPRFRGRVAMWPAYFDGFIMAAKVAGADEKNIEAGLREWEKAKNNIGLWISSVSELHQAMNAGEIWVAPNWGSVTVRDAASGMNLAITIPEEGAVMNTYYVQALNGISSQETQVVHDIMNSWLSPDVQEAVFSEQFLIPVHEDITPNIANLPAGIGFDFTATEAAQVLYRPDYAYVGEHSGEMKDMVDAMLR
jgi:putative spermidine/putrescine transport system substrate-binding protein